MDGKHENYGVPTGETPRLPPRRAALLIAVVGGLSAGAMGFVPLVAMRYWPEGWGGFAVSVMLFAVMFPPMLVAQKALLRRLFRWSGLRLIDLLEGLKTGNIRDDGFFMLLMGAGVFGILAVQLPLASLLPAVEEGATFMVLPLAIVWYLGLVQGAGLLASAEVFPDQKPKDAEEEDEDGPPISFTRAYLAAVANLAIAGPLLFWQMTGPFELAAGALAGATAGAALGVHEGCFPRPTSWRLLAAGLFIADLAAAATGFAAAHTLAAYDLADSDWIPGIAALALFIAMLILSNGAAEGLTRKFAVGGEEEMEEETP
jgi:hypothetical protein